MPATTPILFPSGEDANPLNRRLPAEVVTRRRRETRKVEEKPPEDVQVDLKTALAVKPESRPKWLVKACKMAEDGKVSTTELYNIITGRKFVVGLHSKILRKLRDIVHEHLELFSDKQQRHLSSDEWALNSTQERGVADADDKDDAAARTEDHAARGQAPAKPSGGGAAGEWQEGEEDQRTTRRAHEAQERARLEALRLEEERQRRKAAEREERERWLAAEAEAEAEASRKRKRQLEAETDSSMLMLERLGQQKQEAPELRLVESKGHRQLHDRSSGDGARRQQGGLSRSRSISSGGARAAAKGRRGRGAGSRSRSGSRRRDRGRRDKDRRRRRRSNSASPRDRAAFSEALRKRMAEREAHDTTRIPVVDPGHAQRWK